MKIGDKVKVIIPGKCVKLFYQQTIKSALFDRAKYPGKHGKWKPWNETDCCNRYFKKEVYIRDFMEVEPDFKKHNYIDDKGNPYKSDNPRNICVANTKDRKDYQHCYFRREQLDDN